MPLSLKVQGPSADELTLKIKEKSVKKVKLAIRKTLDGDLIIQDHHNINIIISPEKGKIVTFPKGEFNNDCYSDQDQLFQYLTQAGVINADSIIGGNIYGSLEAKYPTEKKGEEEPIEVVILNVTNFLNKDKEEYSIRKKFIDDLERELLTPDEEVSTELGEVPQEKFKGSVPKYGFPTRGIYRYNY
jgi:hypothetical protein